MSKCYIEDFRKAVLTRLGNILKDKRFSNLSPLLVEKGIDALDRSGIGPRSINIAIQAHKVAVSWYSKMHRIPNPLQYVLKVNETTRESRHSLRKKSASLHRSKMKHFEQGLLSFLGRYAA
jgi:vacuolar-type H+-ATPase subunit E/Vma4